MNDKNNKIAKSLFNYHRTRILQVTRDQEKTVKEIAKILDEKPSRLYYHINLLENLGLLKVVSEKKVNNLIQKYYKSSYENVSTNEYTFQREDASKNSNYITSQLYAFTEEAISRIQLDLMNLENKEISSEASIISANLTENEWKEINKQIRDIISNRDDNNKDNHSDKKWEANYIIMSYLDE